MTLVIGGAQRDVRPWHCIPLPFGNDCAHILFISSMFTLSITEADSQPNVVSHYERSQKVGLCISSKYSTLFQHPVYDRQLTRNWTAKMEIPAVEISHVEHLRLACWDLICEVKSDKEICKYFMKVRNIRGTKLESKRIVCRISWTSIAISRHGGKLCAHGLYLLVLPVSQPLHSAHCRAPIGCGSYSGGVL